MRRIACPQRCRKGLYPASADIQHRHSYYVLSDKSSISDERIKEVVEQSVKHAPTSFNMQSSRAVVVTGQKSKDLWKLVGETYAKVLGDDRELRIPTFLSPAPSSLVPRSSPRPRYPCHGDLTARQVADIQRPRSSRPTARSSPSPPATEPSSSSRTRPSSTAGRARCPRSPSPSRSGRTTRPVSCTTSPGLRSRLRVSVPPSRYVYPIRDRWPR